MSSPVLVIDNLGFSYGETFVLEKISMTLGEGEFFGIIGPNGSGKTTLLKLILGILKPDQGNITVLEQKPVDSRSRIGYVPQFPSFRREFPIPVEDVVIMGRLGRSSPFGGYSRTDRECTVRTMEALQIGAIAKRPVRTLSGGQIQRMLIARALASEPDILILDEPTANIDIQAEENIFGLLRNYNRRMTIIVVSHDIGFISSFVDRVGCLNRTLSCHRTSEITGWNIAELYGTDVKLIEHTH